MSYYKNLITGQWQIGDIVMGYGTNIKVDDIDVKSYDVDAKDYQVPRSDEKRFGQDSLVPTTIEFNFRILHNRLLPGYEDVLPNFWHSMPTIEDLQREWRFDAGRNRWGQVKPLYLKSKYDEREKIIFGRPGQFTVTQNDMYNGGEVVEVLAEFRRGDTYTYSLYEYAVTLNQSFPTTVINGTGGTGPSWMRILIAGPINHPILTFSNLYQQDHDIVIDLDRNIASGEIVEINSEPWSRRVINNGSPPLNLSPLLIGNTPYLDRLRFDFNSDVEVSLAGSGMNSSTTVLVLWRDVYQVI